MNIIKPYNITYRYFNLGLFKIYHDIYCINKYNIFKIFPVIVCSGGQINFQATPYYRSDTIHFNI